MNKVKLPGSFEGISLEKLFDLIDDFVHQNRRAIPGKQLKWWFDGDHKCRYRVPTLFMILLKENNFIFSNESPVLRYGIKNPDVRLLLTLYKKGTTDPKKIKSRTNEVLHPGRAHKHVSRINPRARKTIYECFKLDCANNNDGKCSTNPVTPVIESSVVTDCLRYQSKDFKFKTWDQVLDTSPER